MLIDTEVVVIMNVRFTTPDIRLGLIDDRRIRIRKPGFDDLHLDSGSITDSGGDEIINRPVSRMTDLILGHDYIKEAPKLLNLSDDLSIFNLKFTCMSEALGAIGNPGAARSFWQ